MRSGGINWLAVIAGAVAFYLIGFLIYGMIVPEEMWMQLTGMTDEQKAIAQGRMAFGPLMPLASAVFLALLFKWGGVGDAGKGVRWAAVVALASAVPAMWYGWVYGGMPAEMTLIDSAHLFLGHVAAGAIIGGWR
ncbi:MAG TPA: DUF1761 family protein [Sphingomicrobium sp.]|nr:DUF1761 family protein [Sphingomicrobium sp.]